MIQFYINYQAVSELSEKLAAKAKELQAEASKEAPNDNDIIGIHGIEIEAIVRSIGKCIYDCNSLSINKRKPKKL